MSLPHSSTKETFKQCGTCSRTFCCILNREYGYPEDNMERAADPLAGGLFKMGRQCGMLWGASLAIGAEAGRRYGNSGRAVEHSVKAVQLAMDSFSRTAGSVNCKEIVGYDLTSKFDMFRFMIKTLIKGVTNSLCFDLADKWAPEAVKSANMGLSQGGNGADVECLSCASETVKRMGGTEEEIITVSGFAGGMGLSGNACGALSAAIWFYTLGWCKKNPGKSAPYLNNPGIKKILDNFFKASGSEILCSKISGQKFDTTAGHTAFIKNGGCGGLINILSEPL